MTPARALGAVMLLALPARAELEPVVAHPEREPRAFPRRWLELSAHGAGAAAECSSPCDDTSAWGYAAGLTAVLRPNPDFAVVLGLHRAWFRWRPEGRESRMAHVTTERIGVRVYLAQTPRLDFWLEPSLFRSAWGPSHDLRASRSGMIGGYGAAIGVDAFVWDHLKLGVRVQVDSGGGPMESSSGGGAVAPSEEPLEPPPVRMILQVGPTVTVVFGPPNARAK
ncbi:MAG: hypothetical protein IPM35_35080 [Myxococcales bacterium]|nr:hypothetical protein [Myxococcales bacterium]